MKSKLFEPLNENSNSLAFAYKRIKCHQTNSYPFTLIINEKCIEYVFEGNYNEQFLIQSKFYLPLEKSHSVAFDDIIKTTLTEKVDLAENFLREDDKLEFLNYSNLGDKLRSLKLSLIGNQLLPVQKPKENEIFKWELLLDFLFEFKHSYTFKHKAIYNDIYDKLISNHLLNAIWKKFEYYYQRETFCELFSKKDSLGDYPELQSDILLAAESEWLNVIFEKSSPTLFFHSRGWFSDVVEEEFRGIILNNKLGAVKNEVSELKNFFYRVFFPIIYCLFFLIRVFRRTGILESFLKKTITNNPFLKLKGIENFYSLKVFYRSEWIISRFYPKQKTEVEINISKQKTEVEINIFKQKRDSIFRFLSGRLSIIDGYTYFITNHPVASLFLLSIFIILLGLQIEDSNSWGVVIFFCFTAISIVLRQSKISYISFTIFIFFLIKLIVMPNAISSSIDFFLKFSFITSILFVIILPVFPIFYKIYDWFINKKPFVLLYVICFLNAVICWLYFSKQGLIYNFIFLMILINAFRKYFKNHNRNLKKFNYFIFNTESPIAYNISLALPNLSLGIITSWIISIPFADEVMTLNQSLNNFPLFSLVIPLSLFALIIIYSVINNTAPELSLFKILVRSGVIFFAGIFFSITCGIFIMNESKNYSIGRIKDFAFESPQIIMIDSLNNIEKKINRIQFEIDNKQQQLAIKYKGLTNGEILDSILSINENLISFNNRELVQKYERIIDREWLMKKIINDEKDFLKTIMTILEYQKQHKIKIVNEVIDDFIKAQKNRNAIVTIDKFTLKLWWGKIYEIDYFYFPKILFINAIVAFYIGFFAQVQFQRKSFEQDL